MNPIKLNESKTIPVKIQHPDGEVAYTNIQLVYGKIPQIDLRGDIQEKDIIVHAINDSVSDTYYISGIQKQNFFSPSFFEYLFIGNADKDNLKKIYFTVPELSSYFHRELNYDIDNDANISGNLKINPLEAKIESLGLSIEIHQGYSLQSNEDHTGFSFKNIIYFSFESETSLTFQNIKKLMYKVIGLLTWVTGYPVSIDSITVSDKIKDSYLYLPLVKKTKNYDVSFPKSFMPIHVFRTYFQTLCTNYFDKKEIFEDIWSRTLPLFDFTGVLEYEVMLYASILDKYFSYRFEEFNVETVQNNNIDISKIEEILKNNEDLKKLLKGTNLLEQIDVKKLFSEEEFKSFIYKQKFYFKHIGEENIKIFIKSGDFFHIKSIRDRAAHGSKETLSTDKVLKYLWKTKMLTMYLIYKDLGVSESDFFKIISNTCHPIVMNCEIDKYLLDLKTGKTILIELSDKEIKKIEKLKTEIKVFNEENKNLLFNSDLSQTANEYFLENRINEFDPLRIYSYEKYIQNLIDKKNLNKTAKYYSEAYIKKKREKKMIQNIVIIY
ncbi:ApeA N-terminal domain 1-containing protein [Acinetobacter pittii]